MSGKRGNSHAIDKISPRLDAGNFGQKARDEDVTLIGVPD